MSTAVSPQQAQQGGLVAFNRAITSDRMSSYLSSVLGERKSSFVNNVVALVANSTMLQKCEPMTVIYAAMKATALSLPLDGNLGQAYVIPYGNQAQFQIGYKGFIQLAIRSGQFKRLNVSEVKEGEMQDFDVLTGEVQFKARANRLDLPTIGYVAYFELTNGFSKSLYMTQAEVEQHRRKFSKAKNSPWDTDFTAMAQKTVLKLLLNRYAPLSIEMQTAITSDQAVFSKGVDSPEYVDNPQRGEEASYTEVVAEEPTAPRKSKDEIREDLQALHTIDELNAYWESIGNPTDRDLIHILQYRRDQILSEAQSEGLI